MGFTIFITMVNQDITIIGLSVSDRQTLINLASQRFGRDIIINDNACKKCGSNNTYKNPKGQHIGLYCKNCNKWIKWIAK